MSEQAEKLSKDTSVQESTEPEQDAQPEENKHEAEDKYVRKITVRVLVVALTFFT